LSPDEIDETLKLYLCNKNILS